MRQWLTAKADHPGARRDQQDRLAIFRDLKRDEYLVLVSDGVGGEDCGALASQTVVDTASKMWQAKRDGRTHAREFLLTLCKDAHDEIIRVGRQKEVSPRATIAAIFISKGEACWVHSGDSRVYQFRGRAFVGRTRDHSVLQILVDRGAVREEEMGTHPDQSKLLQSLGGDEFKEPAFGFSKVRWGDAFLACTDGFWEHITPKEIGEIVHSGRVMPAVLKRAVGAAAQRGGPKADNIAAVAIAGGGPVQITSLFPSSLCGRSSWAVILGVLLIVASVACGVLVWRTSGFRTDSDETNSSSTIGSKRGQVPPDSNAGGDGHGLIGRSSNEDLAKKGMELSKKGLELGKRTIDEAKKARPKSDSHGENLSPHGLGQELRKDDKGGLANDSTETEPLAESKIGPPFDQFNSHNAGESTQPPNETPVEQGGGGTKKTDPRFGSSARKKGAD